MLQAGSSRVQLPMRSMDSVALIGKQNIPTERPSLVGELVLNLRIDGVAWSA
jgi:hypothetical protein